MSDLPKARLLVAALLFAACAHPEAPATTPSDGDGTLASATHASEPNATNAETSQPTTIAAAAPAPGNPGGPVWSNQQRAPSTDGSLGVPACEEYLELMERCIGGQPGVQDALTQARAAFIQAAGSNEPTVRAALAETCKTASEAMRTSCPGSEATPPDPFTNRR